MLAHDALPRTTTCLAAPWRGTLFGARAPTALTLARAGETDDLLTAVGDPLQRDLKHKFDIPAARRTGTSTLKQAVE
jgi:hypothetical protein